MKRSSEVMYTKLDSASMDLCGVTDYQFTEHQYLTRLVDYSFTDVSDNDEGDSSIDKGPLHKLQLELTQLMLKAQNAQQDRRRRSVQRRFSRTLRDRASLRLKAEEVYEEVRKADVLERLNGGFCEQGHSYVGAMTSGTENDKIKSAMTSPQMFVNEPPAKKTRLDLKVFKKLNKCRVWKKKVVFKKRHTSLKNKTRPDCLFGLFTLGR